MSEEWRDIKGYEGVYQISNLGHIKRIRCAKGRERIIKGFLTKKRYLKVTLHKDGIRKDYLVHRLVAETFIPNPQNKPCVDHIDTDKLNNKVENLRWCTYQENNLNELTREAYSRTMKERRKRREALISKSGAEHPKSMKVVQLTLEGEFVRVWDSMTETTKEGFSCQCVCRCCKKERKTHKGFKWMYLSEYEMNFNV